jgi:hypothetical protein
MSPNEGRLRGLSQRVQLFTLRQNTLWRSNSIFILWSSSSGIEENRGHEANIRVGGKTVHVVFKYCPDACCRKRRGGCIGHHCFISQLIHDSLFKDDVTVVLSAPFMRNMHGYDKKSQNTKLFETVKKLQKVRTKKLLKEKCRRYTAIFITGWVTIFATFLTDQHNVFHFYTRNDFLEKLLFWS